MKKIRRVSATQAYNRKNKTPLLPPALSWTLSHLWEERMFYLALLGGIGALWGMFTWISESSSRQVERKARKIEAYALLNSELDKLSGPERSIGAERNALQYIAEINSLDMPVQIYGEDITITGGVLSCAKQIYINARSITFRYVTLSNVQLDINADKVRFENSLIHNIRLNPSKDPIERFEIDNSTVHGLSNFSGQTKSQTLTDSLFLDFNPNMHQGDLQISDSFLIEPSFIPGWSTDAKKNSLQLDNVGVYLNNRSALETVLPAFNEMRQFMGEDDPTVQEVDKVCVYAGDALVAGNDCPAFEDRVVVRFETSETIRLDEYFVQGTWDINDRAIFNDENRVVSASTSVVGSNRFQQSIVKDRIAASGAAVKCS